MFRLIEEYYPRAFNEAIDAGGGKLQARAGDAETRAAIRGAVADGHRDLIGKSIDTESWPDRSPSWGRGEQLAQTVLRSALLRSASY